LKARKCYYFITSRLVSQSKLLQFYKLTIIGLTLVYSVVLEWRGRFLCRHDIWVGRIRLEHFFWSPKPPWALDLNDILFLYIVNSMSLWIFAGDAQEKRYFQTKFIYTLVTLVEADHFIASIPKHIQKKKKTSDVYFCY
jgi:hypothetical protein